MHLSFLCLLEVATECIREGFASILKELLMDCELLAFLTDVESNNLIAKGPTLK
jgi:hypothetical protein